MQFYFHTRCPKPRDHNAIRSLVARKCSALHKKRFAPALAGTSAVSAQKGRFHFRNRLNAQIKQSFAAHCGEAQNGRCGGQRNNPPLRRSLCR